MINKIMQKLTGRQIVLFVSGLVSLLIGVLIIFAGSLKIQTLQEQHMAYRWSDKNDVSQVSCFFSRSAGVSEDSLLSFGYQLHGALEEASIVSTSENENARLWADAFSASGKVTVESNRTTLELNAVGIGGDFFLFHPLMLKSGSYFSGNDLMQDYIILDEEAAWQLFGSNDIVGQLVYIRDIPHLVAGVVEREEGRLANAAGLDTSIVYVSYETLSKYGIDYGINTYEIVMPNPVEGYAKTYVMEHIGVSENEVEIVENTTRFEWASLFKGLMQFGTRSMSSKAIIYPYWENMARGYEDILMLMLVIAVLLFLYPAVLLVIAIRYWWKHRTWTVGSLWHKFVDKLERLREKHWAKSKARKEKREAEKSEKGLKEKQPKEKKVKEKRSKKKQTQEKAPEEKQVKEKKPKEKKPKERKPKEKKPKKLKQEPEKEPENIELKGEEEKNEKME